MAAGIIRMVFTAPYIAMAVAITSVMILGLLILSEYVFLEPYVIGHIPAGTEAGFILILLISILSGLVIPMNVYRIKMLRTSRTRMGGGLAGTLIGTVAGACSCGPVGFAVVSTFGSVGAAASSFLTNYELPVRSLALAILAITLYTTHRSLKSECSIK